MPRPASRRNAEPGTGWIAVADVDLRDTSTALAETSAALMLCLRSGDLFAAERLFGFLSELQPDRRLLLADVVQPLVRDALTGRVTTAERTAVVATCRTVLRRRRSRLAAPHTVGVLLCADRDDTTVLLLEMIALLMDEDGVPARVVEGAPDATISRDVELRRDGAVAMTNAAAAGCDDIIRDLRRNGVAVVVVGDDARDAMSLTAAVGASAGAGSVSDAADMLLYLRGPLTGAEASVLKLAADGCTNVRMAHELGISVSAVKARLESSFVKLRAADRTHAVAIALRERWIR